MSPVTSPHNVTGNVVVVTAHCESRRPTQLPPLQRSLVVHGSPSSHEAVLFGCVQVPADPLQMSFVQTLVSLVHGVLPASNAFAGQLPVLPLQLSLGSHSPTEVRHVAPRATNALPGHETLDPVHLSAASHAPAATRHIVVEVANPAAGHASAVPLQASAASQTPTEGRHVVPPATNTLPG